MIIFAVKIQIVLISQFRYLHRVTAGLHPIRSVWEQCILDVPVQNTVRIGVHTFHLVKHYAIVLKRCLFRLQLIVPAFLLKNFLFFIYIRIKNSIQIHMHQILEILIIAACHRVYGFVRIGHGIQKGIERAFGQFNKRIFYRELFGTA